MYIALEALFALLVLTDTILTYLIIKSGKGVEVGKGARFYIQAHTGVLFLNALLIVLLIGLLRFTHQGWLFVPVNLYMARLCWKNWKVLNG
jgi:hypothetical protein